MKRTSLWTIYISLMLWSSTTLAMDDYAWLVEQKRKAPPAASIAISMLEICIKSELGTKGFERGITVGRHATVRITQACHAKNNNEARKLANYYAHTTEGKAALTCVQKLKPLLNQPEIRKHLGKHHRDISTLMAGHIPSKICH